MKNVNVTKEMLMAAKSAYLCYTSPESLKEDQERFAMLEKAMDAIFGNKGPSEHWKASYQAQQEAYAAEE